ncbi:hypothetical protein [Histidinibacterium lentulum]|uniref:Uncharacterized protein n=1 Tax=Histidinibacterium lentulum TaxID=2480588 RepID=A0A3N2QS80_9RHOB|nr:hypothetical protein [Histidinibacterium lentulum]ROT98068.1 hypothetical protein EAT49_17515 [Histidinibacterium lentulum]
MDDDLPLGTQARHKFALALEAYRILGRDPDLQTNVIDILSDLLHTLHRHQIDFEEVLWSARMHFEEECQMDADGGPDGL